MEQHSDFTTYMRNARSRLARLSRRRQRLLRRNNNIVTADIAPRLVDIQKHSRLLRSSILRARRSQLPAVSNVLPQQNMPPPYPNPVINHEIFIVESSFGAPLSQPSTVAPPSHSRAINSSHAQAVVRLSNCTESVAYGVGTSSIFNIPPPRNTSNVVLPRDIQSGEGPSTRFFMPPSSNDMPPPSFRTPEITASHLDAGVTTNAETVPRVHRRNRPRPPRVTERWNFGQRTVICSHCHALMWMAEKSPDSSLTHPEFSLCCQKGNVVLPLLPQAPDFLEALFQDTQFMDLIRVYNALLNMTSIGGVIDYSVLDGRGPYTFRISGENYHRIGSLLPEAGGRPKFAQLYIYDTNNEVRNRINALTRRENSNRISDDVLQGLQDMLDDVNPYVRVFRRARDIVEHQPSMSFHIRILQSRGARQYIRPLADEVAALVVGDGASSRDVIVCKNDGSLRRIFETHPSYMPLQYPLLFPYGTDGWRTGIPYSHLSTRSRKQVSLREFYAYRLQYRPGQEGTTLLRGKRLLHQFVVDADAAMEQQRLHFVDSNQSSFRSGLLQGLEDAVVDGDVDAAAIGRRTVLPSSFTGGPRNMIQHYQDAMALYRTFGPSDLFITFTCNSHWPEIEYEASRLPRLRPNDTPDVIARGYNLAQKELLKDLTERKFFGEVVSDLYVVEFQKRGLPHVHVLLTLAPEHKLQTAEDIDETICAEIPDKDADPLAYETVVRCMLHGPCGVGYLNAPCMVGNKCSKHYPKDFTSVTTINEQGYVAYRRREDPNNTVTINGFTFDNRWVVPYNRDLVAKYDAHINVEKCASGSAIKYLYLYAYKGPDRATIVIENNVTAGQNQGMRQYREVNEIKQYLDCRYISAIEAMWRTFGFPLQRQHPNVLKLEYHLPNQQRVVFNDNSNIYSVVNQEGVEKTMLTEWFEANKAYSSARPYTYVQFPKHFVWKKDDKLWQPRKKGKCIGRLPFAPPTAGERYYLRMLLNIVRGAQCFEDVRTVNGIVQPTFKGACVALGLLEDDNEWHEALREAATFASAPNLRHMFCTMLLFSNVTNPEQLWERFWANLTEDVQYRFSRLRVANNSCLSDQQLRNQGLIEIELLLNRSDRSLKDFPPMPLPIGSSLLSSSCILHEEEPDYDPAEEETRFQTLHQGLNNDQLHAFSKIMEAHVRREGGMFFVYGSGGTGKTYLYRTLIAKLRSEEKIVISVASSGIAALLLPGGRTSHSRLNIPLDVHEGSCCAIDKESPLATSIRNASMIIWDEAPMQHRFGFEAVDRTFKDLMNMRQKPFGGKLVVLGGDFRQILPIAKGGRECTVDATLHKSPLWNDCHVLHLRINMRIMAAVGSDQLREQQREFADWVIRVGDGDVNTIQSESDMEPCWVQIPNDFLIEEDGDSLSKLIDSTYPQLQSQYNDITYLQERCILSPKNVDVDELNDRMLCLLPGDCKEYLSADSLSPSERNGNQNYTHPPEFLHSLRFSGFPSHSIKLKVGAPIMLLRNICQPLGLCNGTRLIIRRMMDRVIEAQVMTGPSVGQTVLLPRIVLSPKETETPIPMTRRQFPVKLCFAMTINKSQGQTLKNVGVYLPSEVFSHGQLYVAVSRVTSPSGLKILTYNRDGIPQNFTKNVVYKEVLSAVSSHY